MGQFSLRGLVVFRSYQQSLQHYVLGFAAKRGHECDRGGEGTQGISKSTYPFPHFREEEETPVSFQSFLDWIKEKFWVKNNPSFFSF